MKKEDAEELIKLADKACSIITQMEIIIYDPLTKMSKKKREFAKDKLERINNLLSELDVDIIPLV